MKRIAVILAFLLLLASHGAVLAHVPMKGHVMPETGCSDGGCHAAADVDCATHCFMADVSEGLHAVLTPTASLLSAILLVAVAFFAFAMHTIGVMPRLVPFRQRTKELLTIMKKE